MSSSMRSEKLRGAGRSPKALEERAVRLVEFARRRQRALVLTHDNPDPDAISSATALGQILQEKAQIPSTLAYGGIVGRAENRALIKVLKLPFVPIHRVRLADYDLICMVDTQPESRNHSLPEDRFPDVIIDHHPERPASGRATIAEVGGLYGATATILVQYLRALGVEPTREVATALFYGIKADTRDLGRETMPADVDAYVWLFPRTDKEALTRIEHPRLPPEYFRLFHTALEKAVVYDNVVWSDLGWIYTPDMVAEVAERHLYLEGMKWSLALALHDDHLFLSLRTNDRRMNAGRLIREVVESFDGSAGGHGQMAGGRIPIVGRSEAEIERLKDAVRERFLALWGVEDERPVPLLEYPPPSSER
ncbi:MAG TPA: DHH family phosphoesterase [Fredinandcohnia sp.]|nr:DHH family phosphoesterase [Fredinandcohnia sp.]